MLLPHLCEWRPWHFISNQDFTPAPRLAKKHRTWDLLIVIVELRVTPWSITMPFCRSTSSAAFRRHCRHVSHWQLLLA